MGQVKLPVKEAMMKVVLYTDTTLPLALQPICSILNSTCQHASFSVGKEKLHIRNQYINAPQAYRNLSKRLLTEADKYDLVVMCTNVPYENNYFFESLESKVLISFHGWNLLTDLPVANGLVYFIASLLCDISGIGDTHQEHTGCVNDFLWNKKEIDVAMRAAFICGDCLSKVDEDIKLIEDITQMLNLVSTKSRSGIDVVTGISPARAVDQKSFDVFMCHNSEDKPAIREINKAFKSAGIETWLDEEQLQPGSAWQAELENQIDNVRTACVFVGGNGRGPWQNQEIRVLLSEFAQRNCRVIPVILPDAAGKGPDIPLFLKQLTWVDLRTNYRENIQRLMDAIRRR